MKSNKPITQDVTKVLTYNEDGTPKEVEVIKDVLFDRLGVQMHIGIQPTNGNGNIITTGSVRFKKCSEDGYITNTGEERYIFTNILECKDIDILTAFGKIDAILTELVNKKGI
jgi:hypothetical protein